MGVCQGSRRDFPKELTAFADSVLGRQWGGHGREGTRMLDSEIQEGQSRIPRGLNRAHECFFGNLAVATGTRGRPAKNIFSHHRIAAGYGIQNLIERVFRPI